ncbi:hypothetical protein [Streptomyces sp. B93]|uniref:hypothetical protein n=1 Tax=Streptomyces sp. B93 TaxID=2824875 RepID=UPI001B382F21|nr:hypothetical protein [Streptomyces sp. B93]MBQ1092535.1 hypothetical protein [Streptomyces sp. B93]
MKKRSMLAIASLATGFVVAAVTPSHAVVDQLGAVDKLGAVDIDKALGTVGETLGKDSLAMDDGRDDTGGRKKG